MLLRYLANAAPRAPRTLLIDACGQMPDNALRIWPDQTIVSIRQSHDERIIACFVAGADLRARAQHQSHDKANDRLHDQAGDIGERGAKQARGDHAPGHGAAEVE